MEKRIYYILNREKVENKCKYIGVESKKNLYKLQNWKTIDKELAQKEKGKQLLYNCDFQEMTQL